LQLLYNWATLPASHESREYKWKKYTYILKSEHKPKNQKKQQHFILNVHNTHWKQKAVLPEELLQQRTEAILFLEWVFFLPVPFLLLVPKMEMQVRWTKKTQAVQWSDLVFWKVTTEQLLEKENSYRRGFSLLQNISNTK
jgi:hypothetical protein